MNLPSKIDQPGSELHSLATVFGEGLYDEMKKHEDFYFFSPDETTSNKLAHVFDASDRAWAREIKAGTYILRRTVALLRCSLRMYFLAYLPAIS